MKKNVFLAVALLTLMAVGAFAQTYTAESNFEVGKTATAVTITKFVGTATTVNIPPTIQNTPVTTIAGNAFSGSGVTSITIPASVTSIQLTAFYALTRLGSVTFLGTIPRAGFPERAFQGDLAAKFYATDRNNGTPGTYTNRGGTWTLTPAANPATASAAETPATSFEWSRTADGRGIVIDNHTGTATAVRIPDRINNLPVVEIGQDAFSIMNGRTLITSVVIPNTVTKIGDSAFDRQPNLTSVTLPSSLIEIGANAFLECTSLTSITLPTRLTTIGSSAFRGCTALTSITLPTSITSIGNRAFASCTALTTVTIPASVTRITFGTGNNAFQGATNVNATSRTSLQRVGYTGSF